MNLKDIKTINDWVLFETCSNNDYKSLVYKRDCTWVLVEQFKTETYQQTISGHTGTYIKEDYYVTIFYESADHDSTQSDIKSLLNELAKETGWKCKTVNEERLGGPKDVYERIEQYCKFTND